jgi:hypothetical protein
MFRRMRKRPPFPGRVAHLGSGKLVGSSELCLSLYTPADGMTTLAQNSLVAGEISVKTAEYKRAIAMVNRGSSVTEAARKCGVNRSRLSEKVNSAKHNAAFVSEPTKLMTTPFGGGGFVEATVVPPPRVPVPPFREFVNTYFGHWVCPDCQVHHETPDFHVEIMEMVQDPTNRNLILCPPGHSKSTIVTVWATIWEICKDRNVRNAVITKSTDLAADFASQISDLLTDTNLYDGAERNLIDDFGPFRDDSCTWNQQKMYVLGRTTPEKDPTIFVGSVEKSIYGKRFDRIVLDDIADTTNMASAHQVMKVLGWVDKMVLSRLGQKRGKLWVVGTRVMPGDIYGPISERPTYKQLVYPCILDEVNEVVLWPDHFGFEQAIQKRSEMAPADFQLVYQCVDTPGVGSSFPVEVTDKAKDSMRQWGHFEPHWRVYAGLDPAGPTERSGYTSITVLGIDPQSGNRYLIDCMNVKSMKAPQLKQAIFDMTDAYPISEWRVESNGLQAQLVQYNEEITQHLSKLGVRVVGHFTKSTGRTGKWDPEFGVETMSALWHMGAISVPWQGHETQQKMSTLLEQLNIFPMGAVFDNVMSLWFAELGCREALRRQRLPLFNEKVKIPRRLRQQRTVADFAAGTVVSVPLEAQSEPMAYQPNFKRAPVGRPARQFNQPTQNAWPNGQRLVNM